MFDSMNKQILISNLNVVVLSRLYWLLQHYFHTFDTWKVCLMHQGHTLNKRINAVKYVK